MMAFVFHVEFGMNDTPLTQALEQGNYATAERLILDCPHSSYLDDGCYQRTPLYICLCGVDEYHERVSTRNLYLARLLVEHGANVNKRVPVTNFGSEYISPGKSSLELLIDFYIDLTQKKTSSNINSLWHVWNPTTELVVGLNKQYLSKREDVRDDVLALIFDILRHGGDPNIQDERRRTPLHRAARLCPDVCLLRMLHTNGGSLTHVDASGNTPLLSLCSVDADSDDEEEGSVWEVSPACSDTENSGKAATAGNYGSVDKEESCRAKLNIKRATLVYLIKAHETDINHQNNLGQTALFHAIVREDISSARMLLEAGASPSLQANVWKSRRKRRKISPLLASLMSAPLQYCVRHASLYKRMTRPVHPVACLVDAGYFSTCEVLQELRDLITSDFPEFSHLCSTADCLLHLMFGYNTASLKQLAARKVFQSCLLETTSCLHTILPVSAILESYPASWSASTSLSSSQPSPLTTSQPSPSTTSPSSPPPSHQLTSTTNICTNSSNVIASHTDMASSVNNNAKSSISSTIKQTPLTTDTLTSSSSSKDNNSTPSISTMPTPSNTTTKLSTIPSLNTLTISSTTNQNPSTTNLSTSMPSNPSNTITISSVTKQTASATSTSSSPTKPTPSTLKSLPSSISTTPTTTTLPLLLSSNPSKLEEYLTLVLNSTVLRQVVQLLQLPTSLLPTLEAQLLFLRMMLKLSPLTTCKPAPAMAVMPLPGGRGGNIPGFIGARGGDIARFVPGGGIFRILPGEESDVSADGSDDDSYSISSDESVEGDSDLEYW